MDFYFEVFTNKKLLQPFQGINSLTLTCTVRQLEFLSLGAYYVMRCSFKKHLNTFVQMRELFRYARLQKSNFVIVFVVLCYLSVLQKPRWKNMNDKKKAILLMSRYRGGSSFIGNILNKNKNLVYFFEPLAVYGHGDDRNIEQKVEFLNNTFHGVPPTYQNAPGKGQNTI